MLLYKKQVGALYLERAFETRRLVAPNERLRMRSSVYYSRVVGIATILARRGRQRP